MLNLISNKECLNWPLIRAHLCTFAITLSYNSTWRVPREAARFGGVQYGLILSVALLVVALPLALLQLALGQLSQQDTVGLWRAVPIFKGVGYLRLLVSFFGSIYTAIYLALTAAYFLYTITNSTPFIECTGVVQTLDAYSKSDTFNSSNCFNLPFMSHVKSEPEYFIAVCLIILFTWISLPFILYSPVKLMKRVFFVLGPLVIILSIMTVSGMAADSRIQWMIKEDDWSNFLEPNIWLEAITQALLTSQVAGGYLISAGDSIYSNNDIRCIGGSGDMETGSVAVLAQIYIVAAKNGLSIVWPLIAFATLIFSGIITMLTCLYPMYDRIRRVGGVRWRAACAGSALVCAGASMAVLAGRWHALSILEALAVPMLVCSATVLEVLAFIFIYGSKALMEDMEFLTGEPLSKFWVWGWWLTPCVLLPFLVWWAVVVSGGNWQLPPWPPAVLTATSVLAVLLLVVYAVIAVARQDQYDIIAKLKSSFKPSRHWGPRDPIAHYYWLSRREQVQSGNTESRYRRRHLGQMSGSFISKPMVFQHIKNFNGNEKRRSNSDDWIYTIYRKKYLQEMFSDYMAPKHSRSKSLEWAKYPDLRVKKDSGNHNESVDSVKDDSKSKCSENEMYSKC
ncbi:unnamed protein product [Diatraea saccharalis]|uniref:Uncharacterized protein n=1 Tax=Diatraea saccharalis TaxID=40085 RepID=A0A9P0C2M6_9NEOP|nr:unnamed protein product [Diatraea saccharalis]